MFPFFLLSAGFGVLGSLGMSMLISSDFPMFVGGGFFNLMFSLDSLAFFFLSVLLGVVACVWGFSAEYMGGELYKTRFHAMLGAFVVSMVVLICSSNLFFLLLGWDGLGVTSFLLICFYKTSVSWSSSLKTFLINRLGDGLLLLALAFMVFSGSWSVGEVTDQLSLPLSFLFFMALATKSAQFPFSSWLPAAMAAPTPVSALVHSSTLVTAGMYVLMRVSYFFNQKVLLGFLVIGLWTVFIASASALVEKDMKKVVAFSTLSQLGLMGFSLGKGFPILCFFHLVSHALFKAKMFICAGYGLLGGSHKQDVRSLEFYQASPVVEVSLLLSLLNLKGLCFLSGFFSKDFLIEGTGSSFGVMGSVLLLFSLFFTSGYSARLFFSVCRSTGFSPLTFSGVGTFIPLYLSVSSIIFGYFMNSLFLSESDVGGLWKSLLLFLFVGGGLVSGFYFFLPYKMTLLHEMGGLKYFNSDSFLGTLSKLGLHSSLSMDKGWLSIVFWLPSLGLKNQLFFPSLVMAVLFVGGGLLVL